MTSPRNSFLLAFLLCISVVCATADTQSRGDTKITYNEPSGQWNNKLDSPPIPVGGVAGFVSKLYYPAYLRVHSRAVQGQSFVIIRVNKGGRVTSVTFSPHMHPELERVVTEAAYACSWIPAKQHGILTDGAVRIPINFTLSMSQKSKNPAGRVFNKAGYADLPEGVIEYVWPSYPYMARLNDYDGEGWYQLQIDRDTGRVTDVIILKSTTHKVLDDAAITAFRKWRFRPHTSQSVILPATFFLQGRKLGEARRLAVYAPEPEHPVTRHSGVGTYRFIVDYNTGTVKDVQVIRSSGRKTFDAAVVKAYRQWRFLPHKIHSVDTTVGFGL